LSHFTTVIYSVTTSELEGYDHSLSYKLYHHQSSLILC